MSSSSGLSSGIITGVSEITTGSVFGISDDVVGFSISEFIDFSDF
jgi:hypothetical protein